MTQQKQRRVYFINIYDKDNTWIEIYITKEDYQKLSTLKEKLKLAGYGYEER